MVELLRLSVAGSDTPYWVGWRDRWFGLDQGKCFTDVGSVLQDTQLWYEQDCGCIIMGKNMIGLVRGARGGSYVKYRDSRVALDQSENYSRATGQVPKITQFNA